MSERYYLLRNNRESGPFTLDELLQQCLLPGDLLWVEGRSQNWTAPYELPEIKTALPKGYSLSPSESAPFEHISDREQALRAEALRRRALAALYQQQQPVHVGTPRPEMHTGGPLVDPEELEVVHHKPERSRGAVPEFLLFCTLSALVVVGWRGGVFAHLIQVRPQASEVATQRLDNESAHGARALTALPQPAAVSHVVAPAPADTTQRVDSAALAASPVVSAPLHRSISRPPVSSNVAETTATAAVQPTETPAANTPKNTGTEVRREPAASNAAPNNTSTAAAPATKEKDDKPAAQNVAASKPDAQVEEAPKEEKKRGFLRGLFGKKKKKEEAAADAGAQ